MVFIVGLTGGIGSGKSSVAKLFATWGATVVDADQIAHNLLAPGSDALTQVAKRFGSAIIDHDGQLNRAALAKIVFTNPTARADLEAITHPLIAAQAWNKLTQAKTPIAIYDVPLLAEQALAGHLPPYDGVVVVETELNTRLQRLNQRGLNPTQAKARINNQASDTQRRQVAAQAPHHWIITNNTTLSDLQTQTKQVWQAINALTLTTPKP
jgi:dephospho-coA kinase